MTRMSRARGVDLGPAKLRRASRGVRGVRELWRVAMSCLVREVASGYSWAEVVRWMTAA